MLVKILVENFKSFDKTTELTMISSSKIRIKPNHRVKLGSKIHLLKHSAVYGANASGKTNLVDFFQFFKMTLKDGLPLKTNNLFCRMRKENEARASTFEIQMEIDGSFFAYGFSAHLAARRIKEEWLYELFQNGKSKEIFTREIQLRPVLNSEIKLSKEEDARFQTYAMDFQGNVTDLFLTEMNRGKKYDKDSRLYVFKQVYDWLIEHIKVVKPGHVLTQLENYFDNDALATVTKLLSAFDTGITRMHTQELDINEFPNLFPITLLDRIMDGIRHKIEEKAEDGDISSINVTGRTDNSFFNLEVKEGEEPKLTTIKLRHGKSVFDFDFEEESDGTKRLFDLIDMLLKQEDDVVFVVDELDRSLHPKLTEKFIELFSERHSLDKTQLIFTTHEDTLLTENLLRRDEIWFVERNKDNTSELYSLDKFKERYDKKLDKAYLEGRYGAVPVFKSFSFKSEEDKTCLP